MAGLGAGVFDSVEQLGNLWQLERRFEPNCSPEKREERMARWALAVQRARFMG